MCAKIVSTTEIVVVFFSLDAPTKFFMKQCLSLPKKEKPRLSTDLCRLFFRVWHIFMLIFSLFLFLLAHGLCLTLVLVGNIPVGGSGTGTDTYYVNCFKKIFFTFFSK